MSKETTTKKKDLWKGGCRHSLLPNTEPQSRWVLSCNIDFKAVITKAMMVILHESGSWSRVCSNPVQIFFCSKQFQFNLGSSRILTSSFMDLVAEATHMLPGHISQRLELTFRSASSRSLSFITNGLQHPPPKLPTL